MKLSRRKQKVGTVGHANPYKVDVAGSTPAAPTILKVPNNIQVIEIPEGWEFHETIAFANFEPFVRRVLRKIPRKKFENNLNGSRRRKLA